MVEVILLQIPPAIREALRVHMANHHNGIVYAEHVLPYGLIFLPLDLIQGPYHGIIVMLVTECLLHVHQQVLHGDILAFIQCVSPFTGVPMEQKCEGTCEGIILLEEGIHIKLPECVHHLCPWIGQLKDRHIQSCRCQPLLFPTPSVAPASMPVAHGLTHIGVPIRVQCPSVRGGRRQASSAHHCALRLRWSSAWSHSPCAGGKPSISCPFYCIGSPSLLGCISNQLH